ncbi:MAG: YARHG domain-containing protein, partial [Chitinispirillales bacterium]|nr:YARHG domain-containing protein [Chitinispirillales bacterium]
GKSWCYGGDAEANCQKYGRLYDWETAKTACPSGWRLPSREEWHRLVQTAGGEKSAGIKLKSKSGWQGGGNGTDDYGFSALPGGMGGGAFSGIGSDGYWWNTMRCGDIGCENEEEDQAWHWGVSYGGSVASEKTIGKSRGLSVRCVAENAPAKTSPERYLFEQNFAGNDVSIVFDDYDYALFSSYAPNIGFSAGKRVVYNGSVLLLDLRIPETALAALDKKELRLLRNAIFAKHGMIFQSEDLKAHFKQFDWYNPKSGNVTDKLTDIDKRNIENIQAFENAKPKHNLSKKDLAGSFNDVTPAPSNCRTININDDNAIGYSGGGEDGFRGSYKIENGFLSVLVTEQPIGEPEYLLDNRWRWPSGVTYREGIAVYKEPVKLVFPVGDVIPHPNEELGKFVRGRQIGSVTWWWWIGQ